MRGHMAARTPSKKSATQPTKSKRAGVKKTAAKATNAAKATKTAKTPPKKSVNKPDVAALEQELEAARVRISELESRQNDVINRIEWILDTLRSALEDADKGSTRRKRV